MNKQAGNEGSNIVDEAKEDLVDLASVKKDTKGGIWGGPDGGTGLYMP